MFFSHFIIFFLYSTSFCFSSSGRFLYCSRPCCCGFFSYSYLEKKEDRYREIRSIKSEYGKIRTRKNNVFGDFSRSASYLDNDEEHLIHSKSGNIEIMINDEADKVIEKLFESIKNRYQNNLNR